MEFRPDPVTTFTPSLEQAQAAVWSLGARGTKVRPLAGGTKPVFEIEREGADPVILKVHGDGLGWRLPKEAHVAGLIGDRLAVPIPRWLKIDETRTLIPHRYALTTKLEGRPLTTRHGQPEAEDLYRQFGAALKALGAVTLPSFGYILGDGYLKAFDSNLSYMTAAFRSKFRDFADQGGDPALIAALQGKIRAGEGALAGCAQAVLCHNDIHPGNVLVGQDAAGAWRITGLLDLENATAADPLFDLAKALDQVAHDYAPGRDPLLEGYGSLGRPDAWAAVTVYRIYHKLEMRNWLVAKGQAEDAPGPANLLADLERLAA